MIKLIKKNYSKIKQSAHELIKEKALRDRALFYNEYYGCDTDKILFFKNIISPGRFLAKMRHGQILPSWHRGSQISSEVEKDLQTLKKNGIVIIPGIFRELAEKTADHFSLYRDNFSESGEYYRERTPITQEDIMTMMLDERILAILEGYYGRQPLLSGYPIINCTYPAETSAKKFNNKWHYDTVNQLTMHVLFSETGENDNGMLYAVNSHKKHHVSLTQNDYYYSEEYVKKSYQLKKCYGKVGTAIIFDPNGLHRLDLKPQSFRSHLHINYNVDQRLIKKLYARSSQFGKAKSINMTNNSGELPSLLSKRQKQCINTMLCLDK